MIQSVCSSGQEANSMDVLLIGFYLIVYLQILGEKKRRRLVLLAMESH